jgi:hypothetical protein
MRGISAIAIGVAALTCVVTFFGWTWGTSAHDGDARSANLSLAHSRERIAAQRLQTRRLEQRVSVLEGMVAKLDVKHAPTSRPRAELREDFSRLESELPGRIGVAFGAPGGAATVLGSLASGPAWSTMKIPVAVAFVRQNGGTSDAVRRAITFSDNDAAMSLWEALGRSTTARVSGVQAVLSDGGDRTTRVQGRVVRPGFSPFGQTRWSLKAQQAFAGRLPCVHGARQVLDLMGEIDPSQRWGLGQVGVRPLFKGGWGPSPAGAYLVRQFGLIRLRSGTVAVAIAAEPGDGSFATGTRYLDRLAQWVASHATGGPRPMCR